MDDLASIRLNIKKVEAQASEAPTAELREAFLKIAQGWREMERKALRRRPGEAPKAEG